MGRYEFKGASLLLGLVIGLSALSEGLAQDIHYEADASDCRLYYEIENGTRVQKQCKNMFKFDEATGGCVKGTCKQCDCGSQVAEECHVGEDGRWVVDPSDCHGFFMCAAGYKVKSFCDYMQVYDPESRTCVYGACGQCNCTTTTDGSAWTVDDVITDASTVSKEDNTTTTSTDPTPTTPATFDPSAICRIKPDGSFFTDAYHCRQYWVCRNREPVRLMCMRGLWFDDVNFVCNYPHLVNCTAGVD